MAAWVLIMEGEIENKELRLILEAELIALADKVNLEGEEKKGLKNSLK